MFTIVTSIWWSGQCSAYRRLQFLPPLKGVGFLEGEVREPRYYVAVILQNELRDFLDANNGEWQAILDEHRTDY